MATSGAARLRRDPIPSDNNHLSDGKDCAPQRPRRPLQRERGAVMLTRDGKRLYADIYQPRGEGEFPTLLRRTPYGRTQNDLAEAFNEAHYFATHGYLVVVQDTRGRHGSEGVWYPFVYEAQD